MRISDLIEAPISDITVHDFTAHNGAANFNASDRKLIRSERGKHNIIRAFERTPFVFKIHFVEHNDFDGSTKKDNEEVGRHVRNYEAGIHDSYDFGDGEIKGEGGVITVVMLANLSPLDGKVPMTGWILAHKIGHCFQDHMLKTGWAKGPLLNLINKLNMQISSIRGMGRPRFFRTDNFNPSMDTSSFLTMRSARNKSLTNPFEVFPELMAQYLVNGKITLTQDVDPRIEHMINSSYEKLLKKIVGKVVVEV